MGRRPLPRASLPGPPMSAELGQPWAPWRQPTPASAHAASFQAPSFNGKYLLSTYYAPAICPKHKPPSPVRLCPSAIHHDRPPSPRSSGFLLSFRKPPCSGPACLLSSPAQRDRPGCSQCLGVHQGVRARQQRVTVLSPQVTARWNFHGGKLWSGF